MKQPPSNPSRELFIIGAGVIGSCLAARALAHKVSVTMFDRRQIFKESSWAAAGVLHPLEQQPGHVLRFDYQSADKYKQLISLIQADPTTLQTGRFFRLPSEQSLCLGEKFEQWIKAQASKSLEPIYSIQTRLLGKALRSYLQQHIQLYEQQPVRRIVIEHNKVEGIQTDNGFYPCKKLVIAAGMWTDKLLQASGIKTLGVRAVKGQLIKCRLTSNKPLGLKTGDVFLDNSWYGVMRGADDLVFGSTLQWDEGNKRPDLLSLQAISLALEKYVGNNFEIREHWTGLRPYLASPWEKSTLQPSKEHSPEAIDFASGKEKKTSSQSIEGLWVSTGHFRSGINNAPSSAELVLQQIFNE